MITTRQPQDYNRTRAAGLIDRRYQRFINLGTLEQWEVFKAWQDLVGMVRALDIAEGIEPAPKLSDIAAQECECRPDWPVACRACLAKARMNDTKGE